MVFWFTCPLAIGFASVCPYRMVSVGNPVGSRAAGRKVRGRGCNLWIGQEEGTSEVGTGRNRFCSRWDNRAREEASTSVAGDSSCNHRCKLEEGPKCSHYLGLNDCSRKALNMGNSGCSQQRCVLESWVAQKLWEEQQGSGLCCQTESKVDSLE